MVAPLRHVMDLPLLAAEESTESWTVSPARPFSGSSSNRQGINVGLNLGEAAERASATTCISISSPLEWRFFVHGRDEETRVIPIIGFDLYQTQTFFRPVAPGQPA